MTITLPKWAPTIRPYQAMAIQEVLAAFESGAQIVMLDAPTGSGKTLIGEMVRQYLHCRALYLCSSLSLQSQFAGDFPEAAILMGRANYATADKPSAFPELNAGDCTKQRDSLPACYNCNPAVEAISEMHCAWCHPVTNCPYEEAKANAMQSSLVCTNTSYFLHEANYVGNLPLGRGLIIIDEADTLEDVMMSFVEVSLTKNRAEEYGIPSPSKKTVESAWIEWAVAAQQQLSTLRVDGTTVRDIRRRNHILRLRGNIKRLNDPATGLAAGGWVYTGYDKGDIAFKPVDISSVAHDYLWRHCKRFLLMSATTISFDAMADTLGMNNE